MPALRQALESVSLTMSKASQPRLPSVPRREKPRSRRRWAVASILTLLLGFLILWGGGWVRFTTDPRVVEIQKMHQDLEQKYVASGGPTTFVEAAAGIAAMGQIRQKMDALPPHLKPAAEKSGQDLVAMYFRGQMNSYFTKPAQQRQGELDRQIRQFEMLRKAWEASNSFMNMMGGNRGATAGTAGGQTSQAGQQRPAAAAPAAQPSPNSDANRIRSRKDFIDRTSPLQRAQYNEYRRAMEDRRKQLGLKN